MRVLLQRVTRASVEVDGEVVGLIDQGILVLLGVFKGDSEEHVDKLLHKLFHYRIFADEQGKMNRSVKDIHGGLLIVSQFTLAAETRKGLRPGFSDAAEPSRAKALYEYFIDQAQIIAKESGNTVNNGVFGADMQVSLTNDGPVTFLLEV